MLDRAGKFPKVQAMSAMRFSSCVFNRIFLNQKSVCFQSHISESEKCDLSHLCSMDCAPDAMHDRSEKVFLLLSN